MAVILGIFYFGQDERVKDEAAVKKAVDNTVDWVMDNGYRNVLIEVDNECNVTRYDHEILKPERVHELIERVKSSKRGGQRLLVSTSYGGDKFRKENVVRSADFLLLHGNGVKDPKRISEMVKQTRAVPGYTPKPIVFNEDDHFDFDKPDYNMLGAMREYASWGYFDPEGYQSPPVNWGSGHRPQEELLRKAQGSNGSEVKLDEFRDVVRRIPRGEVTTYGEVAAAAGHKGAARQVVWALHNCGPDIPWHRVVGAGGKNSSARRSRPRTAPPARIRRRAVRRRTNQAHDQGEFRKEASIRVEAAAEHPPKESPQSSVSRHSCPADRSSRDSRD